MTYCESAPGHPWHGPYHDFEYGFPNTNEEIMFERLALEIMQAGLSWLLVLRKREALRIAFEGFVVDAVAGYRAEDLRRLLADEGIIRNRLKIEAIIANARRIRELRESHGSFAGWLAAHHPQSKVDWVKLFRREFRFTGGEVTGEFLMSLGYLPGAHHQACPIYAAVAAHNPPWLVHGSAVD